METRRQTYDRLIDEVSHRNGTRETTMFEFFDLLHTERLKIENRNLQELEADRLKWSKELFLDATDYSSAVKAQSEIKEILSDIEVGIRRPEEYADALMCLFDSAGRQENPITVDEIIQAFAKKLEINKARKWVKNPDNTYSHIKE